MAITVAEKGTAAPAHHRHFPRRRRPAAAGRRPGRRHHDAGQPRRVLPDLTQVAARLLHHQPGRLPADGHRRHPALAAVLLICLLGLLATPPTAVFFGKLQIFTAAIDGGYTWLAALAIAAGTISVALGVAAGAVLPSLTRALLR